jgi:hypothetical protein
MLLDLQMTGWRRVVSSDVETRWCDGSGKIKKMNQQSLATVYYTKKDKQQVIYTMRHPLR